MAEVAKAAGVATGTAYVYYKSKDELVVAAFVETKRELGAAAVAGASPGAMPREWFLAAWQAVYDHMSSNIDDARFLAQVEASPYLRMAHEALMAQGDDPLMAAARTAQVQQLLVPLPETVMWELGLAPAVRLAASGEPLSASQRALAAAACWRAITVPEPRPRGGDNQADESANM
jgi:AcrR family transcriptional regulator